MKRTLLSIFGIIVPILVNLILRTIDKKTALKKEEEKIKAEQEEKKKKELSIHISDEIGIDTNKFYLKITNMSQEANATNIVVDMRIEDELGRHICNMDRLPVDKLILLSKAYASCASEQELVLIYSDEHIKQTKKTIEGCKLNIVDLFKNKIVIKVRVSAVNMLTGITVCLPTKKYDSSKLLPDGAFVEGENTCKRLNTPIYIENAINH